MKKTFIFLAFFILFFSIIHFLVPSIDEGRCNQYHDFLGLDFRGVIIKKLIDQSEHSYPWVYIKGIEDSSIVILNLALDTSDFFQKAKINDTISKSINSAWIYKEKNGAFIKFKFLDFGCKK